MQDREPYEDVSGLSVDPRIGIRNAYVAPDKQLMPDGSSQVVDILTAQESGEARSKEDPQALTFLEFNRFIEEIQWQPDWRTESDRCCDYYDNNQLDQDTLDELKRRGIYPIIKNLIQPTIDVVLGMEAKTRTDWRVVGDTDAHQNAAEGLSQKLYEAERESRADRANSDAFAHQVKAGLGWVEVVRNWDPFGYPHKVDNIHRREIYWDWSARDAELQDARYLVRRRWFDIDQAAIFFPGKAELLRSAGDGWPLEFSLRPGLEGANALGQSFDQELRTSLDEWEWRNAIDRRICIFEVWYRRFVRGHVMTLPNGEVVEVDLNKPMHQALLANGMVKPRPAVYTKLRRSFWAGPHQLSDRATERRYLPYVPFWGYREDLTGVPYGLIRSMLSPQDEVNARAQKMLWLLSAKRLFMDSDALDKSVNSFADVLAELARADAAIVLNPNRQNKEHGIKVDDNLQLADAQFKMMIQNMDDLQKVKGIFNAMLGNEKGQAKSGIAINSLIEQSTTVLAEINDNYGFSRQSVGQRLMDQVRQDLIGQPVEVLIDGHGAKRKTIILNKPAVDPETNIQYLENDVSKTRFKVTLAEITSTPAYRTQLQTMLAEVMKGLDPQLQALLIPFYLETTDMPRRREAADLVRKHLGVENVDEDDLTPEQKQAIQETNDMAQELQMRMTQAQVAEQEAKVAKLQAEAQKLAAEAAQKLQEIRAEGGQDAESQQFAAEIEDTIRTLNGKIEQLQVKLANRQQEIAAKMETELKKTRMNIDKDVRIAEIQRENESELNSVMGSLADLRAAVGSIRKAQPKTQPRKPA